MKSDGAQKIQVHNVGLNAAWVSVFLVMICLINFFGVKAYGEAEFVFSIIKVTAVIGYMYEPDPVLVFFRFGS